MMESVPESYRVSPIVAIKAGLQGWDTLICQAASTKGSLRLSHLPTKAQNEKASTCNMTGSQALVHDSRRMVLLGKTEVFAEAHRVSRKGRNVRNRVVRRFHLERFVEHAQYLLRHLLMT